MSDHDPSGIGYQEFLAISAVTMCMLFIFVDMGQPMRVLNVMLYPTPHSMMFWDMVSLSGYLGLNSLIAFVSLGAERKGAPHPHWIKPFIILSIPWAVSIHTVTAFLYCGLPGRSFWLTAILAPRFLASAFAGGPALLFLLCLLLSKISSFDVGKEARQKLGVIVTYAMCINVFFICLEMFTAYYSKLPEDLEHFNYVFRGAEGNDRLAHLMWISLALAAFSLVFLLVPKIRANEGALAVACVTVFASLWIDKGMGLIVGGFIPSPLGVVTTYKPSAPEWTIVAGIWALGALMITVFYKIVVSIRTSPSKAA